MYLAGLKSLRHNELFEASFSQYAGSLLAAASRLVGASVAEDVVHDVFVRLWERIDTVPRDAVGAWLFRAVRNRALDTIAHRRVRLLWREKAVSEASHTLYDSTASHADTPIPDLLAGVLDLLSGRQREVLVMHCIEGVPLPEVAARLGISPRTAEKHLQLAARQLRRM